VTIIRSFALLLRADTPAHPVLSLAQGPVGHARKRLGYEISGRSSCRGRIHNMFAH